MGGISLLHSPWSRLHQPLAGTLPYGARTFLIPFGTRSSGHLAHPLIIPFPGRIVKWVGSAHTRHAIGLRAFGRSARAWSQPATCAKARRATGAPCKRGSRLAEGEPRRAAWRCGAVRPAPHRLEVSASAPGRQVGRWAVPTPGSVGSAHTRHAIGLRAFGQSARAWGQPAACAEARRTKGAPCLRGSRLAEGEPRRAAWRCGAVRPAPHRLEVSASAPGRQVGRWAVPTPGTRLGCAPSVEGRARGASLRLARKHGAQRARRASGGHGSRRASRDAQLDGAGRFAPCPHRLEVSASDAPDIKHAAQQDIST